MNVNFFVLAANPFFESYLASDFFGKLIFLGLIALSIVSWIVLIYKGIMIRQTKINAYLFQQRFLEQQKNCASAPLAVDLIALPCSKSQNPFLDLYVLLKKQAIALLNKDPNGQEHPKLSVCDLDSLSETLHSETALQTKKLEKNLYLLSTVVSLAPFLGLLGTVWGILITFSNMQAQLAGGSQGILEGLSLALTTTVLGLVDAIPALIGYNYLKNTTRDFRVDMESFNTTMVSAVEMQYKRR
jgi:biopolymer transport protein TolQ